MKFVSIMISLLNEDFTSLNIFLQSSKPSKIFILVDENTHEHCLPILLGNLATEIPIEILEIEAGEEMKTLETAAQLWEILAEMKADRQSLLMNVGGGVITDLGGFVASTYKRGIQFVNVPTSLLGMCDASIGGKTGIDHAFLKNIVGTFALPEQVFLHPQFLQTLPYNELRSGFAEMLKHGLIADKKHWTDLTSREILAPEHASLYIERSTQIKQEVVEQDFKEKNIRKTLNFGHTVGHAIESLFLSTGKIVPHGECVSAGMICESYIANKLDLLTESEFAEVVFQLDKFFPRLDLADFSTEAMIELMKNDKKNEHQEISFSLINAIGACLFDVNVTENLIKQSLDFYQNKH